MAAEPESSAAPAPVPAAEAPADDTLEVKTAPEAPAVDETYDEALLVRIKGRVQKPTRPDNEERDLVVNKLQEQIDKASARIKEIKGLLDSRAGGPKTANPEVAAIRERLAALRAEWDATLLQKKRLQSQNDDKKTDRDKLFNEQRSIRDSLRGPANLQALEAQLQEMEFKLTHESLTAAQEKALRERKERTEKDKPAVARLAAVSAAIDAARAASDDLRAQIKAVNEQLDKIKSSREAEEAKLAALRASEAEARSDVPALHVEKKEQWEVIQALREKQREVRSAFNDKWEEFKKRDRAFKAWFAQERKKRQEQRRQEYEERQAARKARETVEKPSKYEMEVYTCEQVLSYLRQFLGTEKAAAPEKKDVEAPAPGMKLLSKKGDGDEDSLFTGMGGKKGRGARKAAEKLQSKATDVVKKLPAVLPLETLKTFLKMGIEAPKGNDDVPRAIADVEAKKRDYEEKRDKAAAEPEPEEEEAEEDAKEEQEEEAGVEDDGQEGGKQESNKDSGPDAAGPTPAEANGGVKAVVMPVTAGKDGADAAADGLGVKLRITDDGEVSMEVKATA